MYRNTLSFTSGNIAPGGPTPVNTELSTADLLAQKREEIDREIDEFRAAKEREFKDFARSLRKQKQQRRRQGSGSNSIQNDSRPGALGLLAIPNKNGIRINGFGVSSRQSSETDSSSRLLAPLSKPTTGVDKLSIQGETLLPSTLKTGSPASPNSPSLQRPSSRSPQKATSDPPTRNLTPPNTAPPTPPTPNHDNFSGVFTPSFLPLLDSRPNTNTNTTPTPTSHPTPQSPSPSDTRSLSLPSSSTPSPTALRPHRANTEPLITTTTTTGTSLPSALRTVSDTSALRKRKHVTFQLADSAIVEPSSSYEEMPSPSPREEGKRFVQDDDEEDGEVAGEEEEEVPTPTSGLAVAVPSPMLRGGERRWEVKGRLGDLVAGGATGGFFELDEEMGELGEGEVMVDVEEEEDEDGAEEEGSPIEVRGVGDEEDGLNERGEKSLLTYEYGGSVPIDIVRPSSSWVGSFGH